MIPRICWKFGCCLLWLWWMCGVRAEWSTSLSVRASPVGQPCTQLLQRPLQGVLIDCVSLHRARQERYVCMYVGSQSQVKYAVLYRNVYAFLWTITNCRLATEALITLATITHYCRWRTEDCWFLSHNAIINALLAVVIKFCCQWCVLSSHHSRSWTSSPCRTLTPSTPCPWTQQLLSSLETSLRYQFPWLRFTGC